jgi:hypothetical protein
MSDNAIAKIVAADLMRIIPFIAILPSPACVYFLNRGSGRGKEPGGRQFLRLIQIRFTDGECEENLFPLSSSKG